MPITREDRFLVSREVNRPPGLMLESAHLAECVVEANTRPYRRVSATSTWGFEERTLDVFSEMPQVAEVSVYDAELDGLDGIYSLRALSRLSLHAKRAPIDFARLPPLEFLNCTLMPADSGLETQPLKTMHCWHFNPKLKSFEGLQLPGTLEELQFNWANPATLAGLTALPRLRHLELHRCRSLASLDGLDALFPKLERLVITTAASCLRGRSRRGYGTCLI